jgi:transposase-like protein
VRSNGQKEVLGLWLEQTEGAAFWHRVLTEAGERRRHRHPDRPR